MNLCYRCSFPTSRILRLIIVLFALFGAATLALGMGMVLKGRMGL